VQGEFSEECWFLGHKVGWGGARTRKLCKSSGDGSERGRGRARQDESAVGTSAVGASAVGTSAVGKSAVGTSAVGTSAVGASAVGASAVVARGRRRQGHACGLVLGYPPVAPATPGTPTSPSQRWRSLVVPAIRYSLRIGVRR